jgi:hypothetical protein
MRRLLGLFALLALLAGCETSPLGGRCSTNAQCDPNTTNPTAHCVSFANPSTTCSGSTADCLCCPINIMTVPRNTIPMNCLPNTIVTDSGAGDGATTDAAPHACNPVNCVPGTTFCNNGVCTPVKMLGQACGAPDECGTGFCVDTVCCNSACTGATHSCNVSTDFAGECMEEPMDAGTDAETTDAATQDAAKPDAAAMDAAAE